MPTEYNYLIRGNCTSRIIHLRISTIIEILILETLNLCHDFPLSGYLSASSHLSMYLDMALMAQGTQISRVEHQSLFFRKIHSILYRSMMMNLCSRSDHALLFTHFAKRVLCQYITPKVQPAQGMYQAYVILILCHIPTLTVIIQQP